MKNCLNFEKGATNCEKLYGEGTIIDEGFSFVCLHFVDILYSWVSRIFLTVTFSINFEIICRFQNNKKIFYAWEHCHIKHKKVNKSCLSFFIVIEIYKNWNYENLQIYFIFSAIRNTPFQRILALECAQSTMPAVQLS